MDVNLQNFEGHSPLIISITEASKIKKTKILLERSDLDVNIQDKRGYTALMYASHENHIDMVSFIFLILICFCFIWMINYKDGGVGLALFFRGVGR